jgi:biotin carboxyl carrier protein
MADGTARSTRSENSLDDIERRLQAFEHATRRLSRAMPEQAKTRTPAPIPAPADPTTGSGRRPARDLLPAESQPRGEEISGLRPAVAGPPQTGALTARSRAGGQATPGFTSKIGKPAIAPVSFSPAASAATPAQPRHARPRRFATFAISSAVIAGIAALVLLPRAFTELPQGAVWAPTSLIHAPRAGLVAAVPIRIGDRVEPGQTLLVLADSPLLAERDGAVARMSVSSGTVVASGEPLLELADTSRLRIVAPIPGAEAAAQGDRVRVRLLGEDRVLLGAVEAVLPPSAPGFWTGAGTPPLRVVVALDAGIQPPRLGQGARVVVIGSGAIRPLLLAIRDALPW